MERDRKMTDVAPELYELAELRTMDIAIAGQKLDNLASIKGGSVLAYSARQEVRLLERAGFPTIEAIHKVYRLIIQNKL